MIPKFRAWNTFHNKWVKHFYITENGLIYNMEQPHMDLIGAVPIEQSGLVVMQSTGLFDKNGKEIFGGDVIRVNYTDDDSPWTDAIIWSPKDCAWYLKSNKELLGFAMDEPDIIVEVIGNIYENPELVEVNND
ncbi:TPA: hypothetical protein U1022_001574 [Streptococcus suis]|nr:hypothetical protein [Streptococcus suis]